MKTPCRNALILISAATAVAVATPVSGAGEGMRVGATFPVVGTGQTKCYGSGRIPEMRSCPVPGGDTFGQDAQYPFNTPGYTDNGNGTVTDDVTGLMWQKAFLGDVSWANAAAVAARADTGGHRDWRVPTIKELYSLINFQGTTGRASGPSQSTPPSDAVPYIDTRYFSFEYPSSTSRSGARYIDAQYVSSTAYVGMAMGAPSFFGVNFADGRIKGYPQRGRRDGGAWYARFVRGNPDYGKNDFHDDGNGAITDRATGLTWMQADSGQDGPRRHLGNTHYTDGRMDWPEALAYCQGLRYAGSDDWRLPNAKELQGLIDYTRSPQTTRSAAIDALFIATQITNEADKPDYPGYWASTTHLDGRFPGTAAVVVFFGEALGAPSLNRLGGGPGMRVQGGGGQQQGRRPPPPGGGGPQQGFGGQQQGWRPPPPPGGFGPRQGGGGPEQDRGNPSAGQPPAPSGGGGQATPTIIDVHGAGAQRSDPKIGTPGDYPKWGQGPQGDVRRVYNHVRCVRNTG
ncbi:MAG TPA: DUF1566 domain-containing protein [Rhodospirillales bacterium]|nr:DUF1566 domain-containing protein [Rhodospirillales bacterium]